MHVAELLVSHGASLNAKTFLEETPIGVFITDLTEIKNVDLSRAHFPDCVSTGSTKHKLVQTICIFGSCDSLGGKKYHRF